MMAGRLSAQHIETNLFSLIAGTTSDLLVLVGEWVTVDDPTPDSPRITGMELKGTKHGQILASFQGSMFAMHISHPPGSTIAIWLDGKLSTLPFISEDESTLQDVKYLNTGVTSAVESHIPVGDHQLLVNVSSEQDLVTFDRIDIVFSQKNPAPTNYSIDASSVPAGDVADDTSNLLRYSTSGWKHESNPFFWNSTSTVTTTPGAWMQVSFVGTGVWVYGAIAPEGAVFRVEVIRKYGQETTRDVNIHNITRPDLEIPIYKAPLFTEPSLPHSNMYTYNITLISGTIQIDYIRVVGKIVPQDSEEVETTTPSTIENSPTSSFSNQEIIAITVGLFALALLVGVLAILFSRGYFKGRRFIRNKLGKGDQEKAIEPFYPDSVDSSLGRTRDTKGSPAHTDSNSHLGPPSLSAPSTNQLGTSYFSISISGESNAVTAATASRELSWLQRQGEPLEEEDQTLSLSHSDLAKVFGRAEELRLSGLNGERVGLEPNTEELEPALENLARQLASRQSSVG
ncbi:hypothetical protein FS842_006199 [Serendipita sp. 407]|nr:hypothetical protein FS842_006199 [Serendipita sp. 407]